MAEQVNWTAIHEALAAPFNPAAVSFRPQGKPRKSASGDRFAVRMLAHLDARAVQDRLDAVCGAGGWAFDWQPVVTSGAALLVAKGTLTIFGLSKSDVGDSGATEPSKTAVSDALKRAGVMWGIGRYLYDLPGYWAECDKDGDLLDGQEARLRAKLPRPPAAKSAAA